MCVINNFRIFYVSTTVSSSVVHYTVYRTAPPSPDFQLAAEDDEDYDEEYDEGEDDEEGYEVLFFNIIQLKFIVCLYISFYFMSKIDFIFILKFYPHLCYL